jgi:hypothetical protein
MADDEYRRPEEELDAIDELLDALFPPDWQLSRETEHRQYGKERG